MHVQPVALVTGGSRGIGRAVCRELAEVGYSVAVNFAGNEAAAQETVGLLKTPGMIVRGDVSRADDRQAMVDALMDRWGRIDVLVNNAGITSVGRVDILESTEESWDQVLGVNLKGPFFLTQRVVQAMIPLVTDLHLPCIVNISSLSADVVSTNRGDYCISKAGIGMLTKLWAVRAAEFGIRVYEVRPGVIATDMTAGVKEKYDRLIAEGLSPISRWGQPHDVGRAVAALVKGAIPFSTGETINVDGGFHIRRL